MSLKVPLRGHFQNNYPDLLSGAGMGRCCQNDRREADVFMTDMVEARLAESLHCYPERLC